jgi:hypothetical protein
MQEKQEVPAGRFDFLVRFYWSFLGYAVLFVLLGLIFAQRARFPSLLDAGYWLAAALLIVLRYVDIRFLNGQTSEEKPATMGHWRRYVLLVAPLTLGVWLYIRIIVHSLH